MGQQSGDRLTYMQLSIQMVDLRLWGNKTSPGERPQPIKDHKEAYLKWEPVTHTREWWLYVID